MAYDLVCFGIEVATVSLAYASARSAYVSNRLELPAAD